METKSKRLNLLIKPSLYDDLKSLARFAGTSVNDLVNCVLQREANERINEIKGMKVFDEYTRYGISEERGE